MDHLLPINKFTEKSNEYQLHLCIGLIDMRKHSIPYTCTYGSLSRTDFWNRYKWGHVCILENVYTDVASRIHLDISRGVDKEILCHQRCSQQLWRLSWTIPLVERGVNVDGEKLTDLQFADDVTLTTLTMKGMDTQFNDFNEKARKWDWRCTDVKQNTW